MCDPEMEFDNELRQSSSILVQHLPRKWYGVSTSP